VATPPPWPDDPLPELARRASDRPIIVLDDDPTGTQTVADVPVLTSWTVDDLRWALCQDSAVFFVLTNTRSHILSGIVEITPEGGEPVVYKAGDSFVMKPGFVGVWKTIETVRKIYLTVS
jgi:uncharacterized protein